MFLRKGLVVVQVALSFLLLFAAGLFVRSLQHLQKTYTCISLDNLVTFQLSPALNGYDNPRGTLFYRNLLERLRSAPGITAAGHAFFFQAEDGIRDKLVTGVQTCALPI